MGRSELNHAENILSQIKFHHLLSLLHFCRFKMQIFRPSNMIKIKSDYANLRVFRKKKLNTKSHLSIFCLSIWVCETRQTLLLLLALSVYYVSKHHLICHESESSNFTKRKASI